MADRTQAPLDPLPPGIQPCRHRGCTSCFTDQWSSAPNAVTALRTVGAVTLWGVAVATGSEGWLLAALLCYWIGDLADGSLARLTHRETRTGAVLDVLADRLSVCLVGASYVTLHPQTAVPAVVFLLQFIVLDGYLTLAFTRWSLLSANYFDLVDPTIHRLNWSPPAKAANTGAVILVVLFTGSMVAATVLAAVLFAVKSFSVIRLSRLPVPKTLSGCAVLDASAR